MKLIYNTNEDYDQLKSITMDWILHRKGTIVSGMSCRRLFQDMYGIDIDHHVYSTVLEFLLSIDCLSPAGFSKDNDVMYLVL
jgi:hypothetical protein